MAANSTDGDGIASNIVNISTIVPVTAAIFHNGREKPTERWSFELALNLLEDKYFTSLTRRLEKGFGIKEKATALGIAKFKLQLNVKDFTPSPPEFPKGRVFCIDSQEQWENSFSLVFSLKRELIVKVYEIECNLNDILVSQSKGGEVSSASVRNDVKVKSKKKPGRPKSTNRDDDEKLYKALCIDAKGENVERTEWQISKWNEFKSAVNEKFGAVALSERWILCVCKRTIMLNKPRALQYFKKRHWDGCSKSDTANTSLKQHLIDDIFVSNAKQSVPKENMDKSLPSDSLHSDSVDDFELGNSAVDIDNENYSGYFSDDVELGVCIDDIELSKLDFDHATSLDTCTFTDHISEDSYASSFEDSESDTTDEEKDEFGFSLDSLANEVQSGVQRRQVESIDPVSQKLQSFLNSGVLSHDSIFYILLKNAINYVDWLQRREQNHSLQFQWDNEVLQFLESLEFHGGRKVVNLLRGPGHDGEGKSRAMSGFDWRNWNWPLPGKTTRDKMYSGYTTENGVYAPLLQCFLQLSSEKNCNILSLYEDEHTKIIPVALAKDAMQLKPGLLYDSKQGELIGSTLKLDHNYIKQGEPDKNIFKKSIVQEAEVMCLTTLDSKFSLPVGVNHNSKGLTAMDTLATIKQETQEINVCLQHLQQRSADTNKIHANCISLCPDCITFESVCGPCKTKGHKNIEPALRPCDDCLEKNIQCVKAAVICVSEDSESRNSGAQKELLKEKEDKSNPYLSIISPIPDGVHVAKRKRQSFSNWFLIVKNYRINLVQLRELRNDPHMKLAPILPLSSVRNRDRQDVDSIMEISSPLVTDILEKKAKTVTHTVVPEKYRLRDDNKIGVLKAPIATCMGHLGHIYVSDVAQGKVFKIRANHYPANVTVELSNLDRPIGIAIFNDVLYCAESNKNAIAFKDLTGQTIVNVDKLTVENLKKKLKDIGAWGDDCKQKPKQYLKERLRNALSALVQNETRTGSHRKMHETHPSYVEFDKPIKQPVALCFGESGELYVSSFSGTVYVVKLHSNHIALKGNVISSVQINSKLLYGIACLNGTVYISAHDDGGGIYAVRFYDDKPHTIDKIVDNGGSICKRIHSLTTYNNQCLAFSDTEDCCIKLFQPLERECSVIVGSGKGTRDGSCAQFSQPTGICFDYATMFTVDTSTGSLRMTSNVNSLVDYLKYLHLFGETFGLHTKKGTSVIPKISQAITRLENVYKFDKECVDGVKKLLNSGSVTQGPQGTVSSVVMEDEARILSSLCDINNILNRFSTGAAEKFNIKSVLTLVVENTFSEMRSGATDMPLQLEFDYRFSRVIKERLKRQCHTPFNYFTSPRSYYPQVFTETEYKDLPKLQAPKGRIMSTQQVNEMRNWRALHGQSVPQKTVRNMTTKDNPGTLPINLYAVETPTINTFDLSSLSKEALVITPHTERPEILYEIGQTVCVRCNSSTLFCIASLLDDATVLTKTVKANVYLQDPFDPVSFTEDTEKYVEVSDIICAISKVKSNNDSLELDENDLILLLDKVQTTNEVITVAESVELSSGTSNDANDDEIQPLQHASQNPSARCRTRSRKRRFNDDFLYYE